MDRQLKRFDLPEPKTKEAMYKQLDEFLKGIRVELFPFQRNTCPDAHAEKNPYLLSAKFRTN